MIDKLINFHKGRGCRSNCPCERRERRQRRERRERSCGCRDCRRSDSEERYVPRRNKDKINELVDNLVNQVQKKPAESMKEEMEFLDKFNHYLDLKR